MLSTRPTTLPIFNFVYHQFLRTALCSSRVKCYTVSETNGKLLRENGVEVSGVYELNTREEEVEHFTEKVRWGRVNRSRRPFLSVSITYQLHTLRVSNDGAELSSPRVAGQTTTTTTPRPRRPQLHARDPLRRTLAGGEGESMSRTSQRRANEACVLDIDVHSQYFRT